MKSPVTIQTLLMTDVVGSTRLWSAYPDAMPGVIERMEELAQAAVEAEAGELVKRRGEGDSLFCVFPTPAAACRSAARLVRALRTEEWPRDLPLKVRAAIHCGPAHARDGDLFGPMPNRCARLREIGHGDQILLTGAARAQIDRVADLALRDLGLHRLRDLDEPEAVFQVVADDLPGDFPPLRSLTSLRNNLPIQYTSFVGRALLRKELLERLQVDRFTTLTGAGGSGKTRLALQLGAETIDEFPDGVWFIELSEATDEARVVRAFADACGHRDLPDSNALESLCDRLRGRGRALFIVDNAEGILAPAARVVGHFANTISELRFLITSREPLRLRGERIHRVPPLSVPEPGCDDPAAVGETEAGGLFVERSRLHRPEFELNASNAGAVSEIVHRLDGIPLCIEMAASHVGYLGPDQIAARLHDRFALLEGVDADGPARHRTMRETIAWQYDTLSDPERRLLQRLAVFAGAFALDAAEQVADGPPLEGTGVLRLLRTLVDKSLVVATPDGGGMRYRLLQTIADFAAERPEGETPATMPKLFAWALGLAETSYASFYGPDHEVWLQTVGSALDSIHRALDWAFAAPVSGASLAALRMTRFWQMTGRYQPARRYLERALVASSDELRSQAASALGVFCTSLGDAPAAEAAFRRAIEDPLTDARTRGRAWANLAINLHFADRFEEAGQAFDQGVEILGQCGDEYGERLCRYNRALLHLDEGRQVEATAGFLALIDEYTQAGDLPRIARCHWGIALSAFNAGDVVAARLDFARALELGGPGIPQDLLMDLCLCAAALAAGDLDAELTAYLLGGSERLHGESGFERWPRDLRLANRVTATAEAGGFALGDGRSRGRTASAEDLVATARKIFSK